MSNPVGKSVISSPPGGFEPVPHGLQGLAASLLGRLDQITEDIAALIRSDVSSHHVNDLVPMSELRHTLRSHLKFVFTPLGTGHDFDTSEARDTGRRRAVSGVPLTALMHSYRIGAREVWRTVVDEARTRADVSAEDLLAIASDIWVMHDQFSLAMTQGYSEELTVQVAKREAERAALVQALLEGRVLDSRTVWDVADVLGISRHGPYAIVAIEASELGHVALPEVAALLSGIGIASAWRLTPDLQIGIVCVPDSGDLDRVVVALEDLGASARIGVSNLVARLEGVARGVYSARIAMIASRGRPPAVVVFDRSPLSIVAAAAPDVMESVVRSVLGALMDLPDGEREILLGTLETWAHHGASAEAAAAVLYCHPNTVRHRLRRIEKYTGRLLADPMDLSSLCVALEGARRLASP